MAAPQPLLWDCAPHTRAKHELLRRYLQAWFPILFQGSRARDCVTYVEGFAGPGIYETGEPGSPVVALQVFLQQRRFLDDGKKMNVVLIEGRADRLARLQEEIHRATVKYGNVPAGMSIAYHNGQCASTLIPALEAVDATNTPIFAFLDSWGGPDIPLDVARAIAQVPSSEVLVTFGTRFLMQFGAAEEHQAAGDQAFGGTSWRKVRDQPSHMKKRFLVNTYRESLKAAGFRYVLSFEMLGTGGHDLHLVYGTTNPVGLDRMKEAMWKVDPIRGVHYRDPRDPDQLLLDFSMTPETGPLRRAILDELGKGDRTLAQLRDFALLETVYRPPQTVTVVRDLLNRGLVLRDPARGPLSKDKIIRLATQKPPERDALF